MDGTSLKYDQPQILESACLAFDIDFKKAKLIRYYSNLVYDCGETILRMTPSKENSEAGIIGELTFMQFLYEKGVAVAKVILSKEGKLTHKIPLNGSYLTAVCFEKIVGYKATKEDWKESHFEELGILPGSLHKHSLDFQQETSLSYKSWHHIAKGQVAENLPKDERKLLELHQQLVEEFHTYPISTANYGLIHYDIHFGNYLFKEDGQQFILFDFEMLSYSWFVNDIAVILYYAFYLKGDKTEREFQNHFLPHFWKGYESEFAIASHEKEKIPKFLLYRDLLVYSFLNKIWVGKELTTEDIQYKEKLDKSISSRRKILKLI